MKYANNRNIPFVVLLGEEEILQKSFVVKDMARGDQKSFSWDKIDKFIDQL